MKVQKILKVFVFLIMLILFYIFYFKQVFEHFSAQYTNIAKYEETIPTIELPSTTFCFHPIFKRSATKEYNITKNMIIHNQIPKEYVNISMTVH